MVTVVFMRTERFPKLGDLQNLWENASPSTKAGPSGHTTGVDATRTLSFKATMHVLAKISFIFHFYGLEPKEFID